jgi:hypothetical protein
MKAETFRRLRTASSAPVFWSEADVEEALNAGYMELSDSTEWFEQYFEIDLLNDRPYYDLRDVLGASFLAIKPAFDEQTNRWLLPTAIRQFDAHDRRWERVVGEPQRIVMRGLWWLGYWPRIHTEAGLVKQYYTALPPPLVEDEDEPGFPETFHDGCIEFALTDLWAQDSEAVRALKAWADYLVTEAALTAWVDDRASAPMQHGFGSRSGSVAR